MSQLLDAVTAGDFDSVTRLLDGEADVNEEMEGLWVTVLDNAAWYGQSEMVELLLNRGAKFDTPVRLYTGLTIFQLAVQDEYLEIVNLMIKKGVNVNAPAGRLSGRTALQAAAAVGNEEIVELLISKGAEVNAPAGKVNGRTALQAAIELVNQDGMAEKALRIVKLLLDNYKSPVETKVSPDKSKESPVKSKESLVKAKDSHGQNALHTLCQQKPTPSVTRLLDLLVPCCTPDVINARDRSGSTSLHIAVREKNDTAVKLFVQKGVNVDAKDNAGRTALQISFPDHATGITKILLKQGARTDCLEWKDLKTLQNLCGCAGDDIFVLRDDMTDGTTVVNNTDTFNEYQNPLFDSPSISFRGYVAGGQ